MNHYSIDVGDHGFILGLLYLFLPVFYILAVLIILLLAGWYFYRKHNPSYRNINDIYKDLKK